MANQKMTYQTRLYNATAALFDAYNGTQLVYRREFEDAAKGVIESQAEAVRAFVAQHDPYTDTYFCEKFLLEHGYIDPKTRDDDSKA